jgi:hypothetical protein
MKIPLKTLEHIFQTVREKGRLRGIPTHEIFRFDILVETQNPNEHILKQIEVYFDYTDNWVLEVM